jgi:hypothetical protein
MFFRSFSTSSSHLFRGFPTDPFPSGIFLNNFGVYTTNHMPIFYQFWSALCPSLLRHATLVLHKYFKTRNNHGDGKMINKLFRIRRCVGAPLRWVYWTLMYRIYTNICASNNQCVLSGCSMASCLYRIAVRWALTSQIRLCLKNS